MEPIEDEDSCNNIHKYTREEMVQVIKWQYRGKSMLEIKELFRKAFESRPVPSSSAILSIIKEFESSGCVGNCGNCTKSDEERGPRRSRGKKKSKRNVGKSQTKAVQNSPNQYFESVRNEGTKSRIVYDDILGTAEIKIEEMEINNDSIDVKPQIQNQRTYKVEESTPCILEEAQIQEQFKYKVKSEIEDSAQVPNGEYTVEETFRTEIGNFQPESKNIIEDMEPNISIKSEIIIEETDLSDPCVDKKPQILLEETMHILKTEPVDFNNR